MHKNSPQVSHWPFHLSLPWGWTMELIARIWVKRNEPACNGFHLSESVDKQPSLIQNITEEQKQSTKIMIYLACLARNSTCCAICGLQKHSSCRLLCHDWPHRIASSTLKISVQCRYLMATLTPTWNFNGLMKVNELLLIQTALPNMIFPRKKSI